MVGICYFYIMFAVVYADFSVNMLVHNKRGVFC
jgi:hypothetical protein